MAQKNIDMMQKELNTLKEDLIKYEDVKSMWMWTKLELDKTKQIMNSGMYKIWNIFSEVLVIRLRVSYQLV